MQIARVQSLEFDYELFIARVFRRTIKKVSCKFDLQFASNTIDMMQISCDCIYLYTLIDRKMRCAVEYFKFANRLETISKSNELYPCANQLQNFI